MGIGRAGVDSRTTRLQATVRTPPPLALNGRPGGHGPPTRPTRSGGVDRRQRRPAGLAITVPIVKPTKPRRRGYAALTRARHPPLRRAIWSLPQICVSSGFPVQQQSLAGAPQASLGWQHGEVLAVERLRHCVDDGHG